DCLHHTPTERLL
ncbi:Acyl-CoA Delta(11) desaturase, partial [Araneus ventricosus]